jgi:hypothetical protein
MIDYAKRCEPYAENGRTPDVQRRWLVQKKQIPEDAADLALAALYTRLERGETFAGGHELDQALLTEARSLVAARIQSALEVGQSQIEAAGTAVYLQRTAARKPKEMLRHPGRALKWYRAHVLAFLLGAGAAGAAWGFLCWPR